MTAAIPLPAELPISDDIDLETEEAPQHQPHHGHAFSLDDAFSVREDDTAAAAFDLGSDSFLKALQLRPTIGIEEDGDDMEDMQITNQPSYDSTDGSVSTLDIDGVTDHHHLPSSTPPHPSSSSHSLNSEVQPRTPTDDSPPSPAHVNSQFTNDSPSLTLTSSTNAIHEVEQRGYPSVVIDASKSPVARYPAFSASASHETTISHGSSHSSTSELARDPADVISRHGSFHDATQSMSNSPSPVSRHQSSPSIAASAAPKIARSSGPSVLQKVVSKTRPPHLPPKRKDEDEKHNREWEEMMARSRVAEKKQREALQARRLARELSVEANASLWHRSIISDWNNALRDTQLRKLWWNGVPTKLRSIVWERVVGNGLALSKDSYSSTSARAKNLLATQRFPHATLSQLERDISSTLPALHIFNPLTGPLYNDLRDLLCAWVVSRADEGLGYVEGAAKIGGMLLLNLTGPAQAFLVMRNLLETGCLRAFYGGPGTHDDVEAYYRIFDTLLADGMPKVFFNFKQHQISPAAYLPDWLFPLFLDHLPLEACSRIWDVLLLEGDVFLFRAALAMLACLESRLLFPDRMELLAVLKGESSAALQIALRKGAQSPVTSEGTLLGPRYEVFGVNEENIWGHIVEMEEWFKESTWRRLTQRELPDV